MPAMSYLVLARKYRPRNFSEMVGQDHVVQALCNALSSQRLHHAYLFTGTRGVGKTTVSRILAKSLNCQGPDGQGSITASPCGVCQACTDIDSGRFVDYTELDAASNRGVEEVQSLLEQAVYKPVQGRFKVFMIDEVHMLTNTAFNAMLKTLEEPPEYLKFVLATTDPQKVPVTVLSRCLQFNLRPMAPQTIREHLQQVLCTEQVEADEQALRLLARAARGSMRDALSLTDQAIAFGSGSLTESQVRSMLGSVDRSYVFRLIDALAHADGKSVVETSEQLRVHGLNTASTLEEMCTVLQRMAVLQSVSPTAVEGDDDPEQAELQRLAALLPADETQLLYSICLHGRGELGLAPDEYAALTMVLLRLLAFKPERSLAAVAEKKTLNLPPDAPRSANGGPSRSQSARMNVAAPPSSPPSGTPSDPPEAPLRSASPAPVSVHACAPGTAPALAPLAAPAGLRLPVVSAPAQLPSCQVDDKNGPPALSPVAQKATESIAIEVQAMAVHVQADSLRELPVAAVAPDISPSVEGDFWHATVQALVASDAVSAMARELALQSQLVARDEQQWVLRVERESLRHGSARDRLAAALAEAGHLVQLQVEVGRVSDSPARRNAVAAAQAQWLAEKIVLADPFVQHVMRDFGAKIVPGSVKPL